MTTGDAARRMRNQHARGALLTFTNLHSQLPTGRSGDSPTRFSRAWRKRSRRSRAAGVIRSRPPELARDRFDLHVFDSGQAVRALEVDTPQGRANIFLHHADEPRAALVLGHGAGGGVSSRDLIAAGEAALAEAVTVSFVEQPYRVAGRRSPPPASRLDAAWTAVVEHLRVGELRGLPLVVGGRSLGARVACRTAEATGAVAVLCLAFPLQPPGRSGAGLPPSRLPELDQVTVPVLVVQGTRDPFGIPPGSERRTVVEVPGDHSLRTDVEAVAAAVRAWLRAQLD